MSLLTGFKTYLGTVTGAGAVLAFFSLLAKLVGLMRDRILASHFGASRTLDIYYSAFNIPDLIFNLFIIGAVSSAFIPVFLEHYRQGEGRAWRLAQNFLTMGTIAVIGAGVIVFLAADPIARLIAPGFSEADRGRLVPLLRLMLVSPVLFSISSIFGSILQSLQRFVAYAIAPILYNLGIIAGVLWIVPYFERNGWPATMALGTGVLLGALLHVTLQLVAVLRAGFRFSFVFGLRDDGLKKIFRLMIPRTLGIGAYSLDTLAMSAIASALGAGTIAIFTLANNLQFVPISIVGISVATALFPRLSVHGSAGEYGELRSKLFAALRKTGMLTGFIALGTVLFRRPLVELLFSAGVFRGLSVDITADVLGIFMFGVVAQSLLPIISRAFYALQDTKIPAIVTIVSVLVNIALALWFSFGLTWGIYGLALAFVIAGNVNFIALYFLFRIKYF